MSLVSSVRKFIVAAVGLAVVLGVLDEGVAQDVVGVVTAIAVYFVPNDQKFRPTRRVASRLPPGHDFKESRWQTTDTNAERR